MLELCLLLKNIDIINQQWILRQLLCWPSALAKEKGQVHKSCLILTIVDANCYLETAPHLDPLDMILFPWQHMFHLKSIRKIEHGNLISRKCLSLVQHSPPTKKMDQSFMSIKILDTKCYTIIIWFFTTVFLTQYL